MVNRFQITCCIIACITLPMIGCDRPAEETEIQSEMAEVDQPVESPFGDDSAEIELTPYDARSNQTIRVGLTGVPKPYSVKWYVNDEVVVGETGYQLPAKHFVRDDKIEVTVEAGDIVLQNSMIIANSPPEVTEISLANDSVKAGSDIAITPSSVDADGDFVSYSYEWLINNQVVDNIDTETLPGNLFKRGDQIAVRVIASDDLEDGETFFSEVITVANAAPEIQSEPLEQIRNGLFSYQVVAVDPDLDRPTYRLESAPDGMEIDGNTGLIQWKVTQEVQGEHAIIVIVEDGEGGVANQEFTLSIGYEIIEQEQEATEE